MANDITKQNNSEIQEAYATKDIAQSLRRYLASGSQSEELTLEKKLNENKGIFKRFFPTLAQKEDDVINADTLRQIRKNKSEIMAAHHAMYLESTKLQSNAIIRGLGLHLQDQLATFANEKIQSIVKTIRDSEKEMTRKFYSDETEAEKEYVNSPKYLAISIHQIDKSRSVYMEGMEELLDGTVKALKNKAGVTL